MIFLNSLFVAIFALGILMLLYAYYSRLYYQVHRNFKLHIFSNCNIDHYKESYFSKFHIYVLVYCNGLYLSGLLHSV